MTNPQKKTMILEVWTELKTKLMTTLNHLKANHKDNWAVVSYKSKPEKIEVLNPTWLKQKLQTAENSLQPIEQCATNALLSPPEQARSEQLKKEITFLKKQLTEQEGLVNWKELLSAKDNLTNLQAQFQQKNQKHHQQLRMLNEKHDQLMDKLNHLRTLVLAGDLTQLQELVKKGKV